MTDPRQNLPSASRIARIAACPGSVALEATMPAEPERHDPDGAHGNLVHRALAGDLKSDEKLASDQSDMVETCERIVAKLVEKFGPFKTEFKEKRLWSLDANLKKAFSGQIDRLFLHEKPSGGALICDYKTLFGEHEEAPDNLQLMALAVLVFANYADVTTGVTVALIQPWKAGQFTLAEYDLMALIKAEKELWRILDVAKQSDAPRIPGKHCKFCIAQFKCPEAQGQMMALKLMTDTALTEGHQLAQFYEVWQTIKTRGDKLEKLIKEKLKADPKSVPGLKLKPGNERRIIESAISAYKAVCDTMTGEEFASCCKVTIGKLGEAFQLAFVRNVGTKHSKKEISADLELRLKGVVKKEQNEPSIVHADTEEMDLIP